MNKIILTFIMAAGLTFAQDGKRMEKYLNLTPEQKPLVQAILKEQREAVESARKNNASRDELKNIRKQTHDKLASVLTPEQMQKFDEGANKLRKRRNR